MHYLALNISFLLVVSASFTAGQSPTPTASPTSAPVVDGTCASQDLVDECIAAMKIGLNKCAEDNWDCKCSGIANISNCYADCPDDPSHFAAELSSEQICATANAYDKGLTAVPTTWTTPGPREATPTGTVDYGSEVTTTTGPTQTTVADEEKKSGGIIAIKVTGSWLGLVGLAIGVIL
ncbi:hypothetical protein N7495_001441 [Penicillium taxi]|uniref:uncharacterized protein n=1 Tax=Penicillium taxi TaxID=168475 RepID=UPI0025450068|nr:uncharacterized protein N7495_001441 [Penicillium taxi]KAJ5908759.1 hypothetical protein N7495_001441 [Penicillium taxi]